MDPAHATTLDQRSASAYPTRPSTKQLWMLLAATLAVAAGLLVYSQTMSFVWDEGFHLVAAQLINAGKRPYLDFCFPQTPLNAYWNAAAMRFLGETWRVTHVFAALLVTGAAFLTADFVFRSFPIPRWRLAGGLVALFLVAMNTNAVQFGTAGQAYGMCLFLSVAAYRVTVLAARTQRPFAALAAGFFAGAAAGCSLLTAPEALVLLVWIALRVSSPARWRAIACFAVGLIIPFAPVLWLFAQGPRQVFFNVIQYQAIYRRVNWKGATTHDIDVLSAWLVSAQTLFLGILAIAGAVFLFKKARWDSGRRAEFALAFWLAVVLTVYIAIAHPTFERYFVFVAPFAAIVAVAGCYDLASRLFNADRPFWPCAALMLILALALGRALFDDRDSVTWKDYESIAKKVADVTPPHGRIYADELVYFLLHRAPPPGMEFSYSHKLELPPAQEKLYHIVSDKELAAQVKAGYFDTVQSCNDDMIDKLGLDQIFPKKAEIVDCDIYWGKPPVQAAISAKPAH